MEASVELNTPYMFDPKFYKFFIHMEASIEPNTPFVLNPSFYTFIFLKFVPWNLLNLRLLPGVEPKFYTSI
jgi:hypothetical protein